MHRPTVGILALLLAAAGVILLIVPGPPDEVSQRLNVAAPLLRVGLLLGVLWLALPDITRPFGRTVLVAALVAVLLFARRPQLFLLALACFAGLALLRPRIKSFAARRN